MKEIKPTTWILGIIVVVLIIVAIYKDDKMRESIVQVSERNKEIEVLNQKSSSFSDSVESLRRYYSSEMNRMRSEVVDSIVEETKLPDGTVTKKTSLKRTVHDTINVVVHDTVTKEVEVVKKDTVQLIKYVEKERVKDSTAITKVTPPQQKLYVGLGYQVNADLVNSPFVEATYIKPIGAFYVAGGVNVPAFDYKNNAKLQTQVGIHF